MNGQPRSATHQAVVFFEGDVLTKEMLHVEFEAVLDHVVGLVDFAGREVRACFLRIDGARRILGAVFFLVEFDDSGFVSRSWNIPLQHLLDKAGSGPDLGAGPIRLACRSQCPVAWHQRQLWDPQLERGDNTFDQLVDAVRRNRLGLPSAETSATALASSSPAALDDGALMARFEQIEARHVLKLATLRSEQQREVEQLHRHYRAQLGQLGSSLEAAKQLLRDEKQRNRLLQGRLGEQMDAVRAVRRHGEAELARQADQTGTVEQLREQFALELKVSIERATAELHEMLDMREVELFYRDEQLTALRAETARLRKERDRLIQRGGQQLLGLLAENAVAFVAYPAAGDPITVPADAMAGYLDDPIGWLAERYGLEREHYAAWRRHCELPVCQLAGAEPCGEPVDRIATPDRFISGISDRCERHRESADALAIR